MARTSTRTPAPAKRVPRKAPTKKAVAKTPVKKAAVKAPAKKAVKAPAKKAPAKKVVAAKKTVAKKAAPVKKTAERPRQPTVPPTNQRLNALEQRVDALEGERPGRKPLPLLAIKQRGVCGIDPTSDSKTCPYASIYRYQSGCHGDMCRFKQHEAYERRKPPAKAVRAPRKKPAPPPPPVARRRIVKKAPAKATAA